MRPPRSRIVIKTINPRCLEVTLPGRDWVRLTLEEAEQLAHRLLAKVNGVRSGSLPHND